MPKRAHIPLAVQKQVAEESHHRCSYCLTPRQFTAKLLHVEHIIPLVAGGRSTIDNLCLACELCNSYKGTRTYGYDPMSRELVPLFNPRKQIWKEHFAWSEDGTQVIGLTAIGRATVVMLQLNHPFQVEARRWWVRAGWHPPG